MKKLGPFIDKVFNITILALYGLTTTRFLIGDVSLSDKILIFIALSYIGIKVIGNILEIHK